MHSVIRVGHGHRNYPRSSPPALGKENAEEGGHTGRVEERGGEGGKGRMGSERDWRKWGGVANEWD